MSANPFTRPEPPRSAPGYHYEVMVSGKEWIHPPIGAGRCRWILDRYSCKRPAVATLMRGFGRTRRPWDYCELHLYGRWIEGGQVMNWRLVEDE